MSDPKGNSTDPFALAGKNKLQIKKNTLIPCLENAYSEISCTPQQ